VWEKERDNAPDGGWESHNSGKRERQPDRRNLVARKEGKGKLVTLRNFSSKKKDKVYCGNQTRAGEGYRLQQFVPLITR